MADGGAATVVYDVVDPDNLGNLRDELRDALAALDPRARHRICGYTAGRRQQIFDDLIEKRQLAISGTEAMRKFAKNMFFSADPTKCTINPINPIDQNKDFDRGLQIVLGTDENKDPWEEPDFRDGFGLIFEFSFDEPRDRRDFNASFFSNVEPNVGQEIFVNSSYPENPPLELLQKFKEAQEAASHPMRVWQFLDQFIAWVGENQDEILYRWEEELKWEEESQRTNQNLTAWINWGQSGQDLCAAKIMKFAMFDGMTADVPSGEFIDAYTSNNFADLDAALELKEDAINSDGLMSKRWIITHGDDTVNLSDESAVYNLLRNLPPGVTNLVLVRPLSLTPSPSPERQGAESAAGGEASAELSETMRGLIAQFGKRKERDETSPGAGGHKARRAAEAAFIDF